MAPEPAPDGSVYFLRLHARGLDLARVPAGAHIGPTVALDPALAPAAPPAPAPGQAFAAGALPTARGYGLGPRQLRLVPSLGIAGGGIAGRMALFGSDPVGRLDWLAQGAFGHELWQGGSLRLIYRRILPQPQADLFATIHHPGQIGAAGEVNGLPARVRYDGGGAGLGARGATSAGAYRLVLGGSVGALTLDSVRSTRALGWLDLARSTTWTAGPMDIGAALAVTGAAGRTAGVAWSRLLVRGRLYAAPPGPTPGVELRGARGAEWGAVDFERFAVGGEEPPLFEPGILSQQVAMPALPEGSLVGPQVTVVEGRVLLNGVTAYLWGGSASQSPVWQWVAGLEQDVDTPPVPLLRLPGVHAIVGLGYTLNEKPHRVLRLYGTATLRP